MERMTPPSIEVLGTLLSLRQAYRSQLEHQDHLISQRVSWLVGAQAFLLGSFVLLVNNPAYHTLRAGLLLEQFPVPNLPGSFDIDRFLGAITALRIVFIVSGVLISLLSLLAILGAMNSIRDILDEYEERWKGAMRLYAPGDGGGLDQLFLPTIISTRRRRWSDFWEMLAPTVFGCSWLMMAPYVWPNTTDQGLQVGQILTGLLVAIWVVLVAARFIRQGKRIYDGGQI